MRSVSSGSSASATNKSTAFFKRLTRIKRLDSGKAFCLALASHNCQRRKASGNWCASGCQVGDRISTLRRSFLSSAKALLKSRATLFWWCSNWTIKSALGVGLFATPSVLDMVSASRSRVAWSSGKEWVCWSSQICKRCSKRLKNW